MFCCKRSRHGVAGCILLSLSRFVRAFVRCMHKARDADKRGDEGRKVREEKFSIMKHTPTTLDKIILGQRQPQG